MVDVPAAGEEIMSEVNGGKGQNLFARGVVDTYRLLRRQESSRLPMSPGYATRPFNRLSRRQRGSTRDLKTGTSPNVNGSAVSLGSRSGTEAHSDDSPALEHDGRLAPPQSLSNLASSTPTARTETTNEGTSALPSLSSTDELTLQEKLNKQRVKKMKRFTK